MEIYGNKFAKDLNHYNSNTTRKTNKIDSLHIGVIADDFTGASDAASFLVKGGMHVILLNGELEHFDLLDEVLPSIDALVIALKTRSIEKEIAIEQTIHWVNYLKELGCSQIYDKYCSTFDSTPTGNIGSISDALLDHLDLSYTLLLPSLLSNGRKVMDGNLYVNNQLLHHSAMKNHPLNPMWHSDIRVLMKPQSQYPCFVLSAEDLRRDNGWIQNKVEILRKTHKRFYLVPDYATLEDEIHIIQHFAFLPLLTGGSGILESLAKQYCNSKNDKKEKKLQETLTEQEKTENYSNALILCGSKSEMSKIQIAAYLASGKTSYCLDTNLIINRMEYVTDAWNTIQSLLLQDDVLVYVGNQESDYQQTSQHQLDLAPQIEACMCKLAQLAYPFRIKKLIVAGGETSGAVIKALALSAFAIHESVASGVPLLVPLHQQDARIILKSGNFGDASFFMDALRMVHPNKYNEMHSL